MHGRTIIIPIVYEQYKVKMLGGGTGGPGGREEDSFRAGSPGSFILQEEGKMTAGATHARL